MSTPTMDSAIRHIHLPNHHEAAKIARTFAIHWLLSHNFSGEVVDNAAVVVSELVTNALTHVNNDDGYYLLFRNTPEGPVFGVRDPSREPPKPKKYSNEYEYLLNTSGKGLYLVGKLSRKWGFTLLPSHGKVVWALM